MQLSGVVFTHPDDSNNNEKRARGWQWAAGGHHKICISNPKASGKKLKNKPTHSPTLTHRESILIYAVLVRRTSNCNLGQAYCLQIINIHMHLNGLVCVPEANISLSNAAVAALSLFLFRLCFWLGNAKELSITTFLSPPRTPTHPI